jgi:glutathione S-transferase
MSSEQIVLRYFPVQGRAQALRHALADRHLVFEDMRIPVSEWGQRREDVAFAGPFRALPTLTWGNVTVAETLPIASFIAKRSGHYEGLTDGAIARIEAICSCCYIDVTLRLADLVRADLVYPGADGARALALVMPRMMGKLELLDKELKGSAWYGGSDPVIADFVAAETLEVLLYVLGPSRRDALAGRLPRLTDLTARMRKRPTLAKANETRPARFTARPDEDAAIARLQTADLSSVGL